MDNERIGMTSYLGWMSLFHALLNVKMTASH